MRKCLILAAMLLPSLMRAQGWNLAQCLDYARQHNIAVQKSVVNEQMGEATLKQDRAALWPSLSFSMSQSLGYRPFQEDVTAMVQGGQATQTSNKVTENGSYGLNAQWTVFDGTARQKTIKAQQLANEINQLATEHQIQNVEEQIAQLYVQILYSIEAVKVNKQLLETAQKQRDRGAEMVEVGQLARADLAQLDAQLAAAQYDVVNSEALVAGYKRQLKQLLQLDALSPFDVATIDVAEDAALQAIPPLAEVYERALATRPEIRSASLNVDMAEANIGVAKAGYWPTINLNAGIGDNHYSSSQNSIGNQMKQNLSGSVGLSVSVPILDNRRNRTNVEKAKMNKTTAALDLADARAQLSSKVESYWIDAGTNQQRFIAAQSKVNSQQVSYELLDEQFKAGLKNIVELLQGRDALVSAQQDRLQSKYSTLLSLAMLRYYQGEGINL